MNTEFFFSIPTRERVDFVKSLSVMLKSGITINEALTLLAEQSEHATFKKIVYRVRDTVETGSSLSDAFKGEEKIFGNVFVSLVRAGEESGTLQKNLEFLVAWLMRNDDLEREVKAATLYPKLVLSAAAVLGGVLSVFILPRLIPLFGDLDIELPLITKVLLSISLFLQSYWHVTIAGLVLFAILILLLNRVYRVRKFFHKVYLKIPYLGKMLKHYQLALICELYGTLLGSGLTLSESNEIVQEAATNIQFQESLTRMHQKILQGTTLSRSMVDFTALYPKTVVNIVAIGEKSGTLSMSFSYLGEYYTKEVSSQAKRLPTVIEPLLLAFIALVVGLIAAAIILPIYKLTGSITN